MVPEQAKRRACPTPKFRPTAKVAQRNFFECQEDADGETNVFNSRGFSGFPRWGVLV
jgi:hypothetical protein